MGMLTAAEIASMKATLDLVANARLTEISGPGTTDRYGEQSAEGAAVWAGSVQGYLQRGRSMEARNGVQESIERDTFVILDAQAAPTESAIVTGGPAEASVVTIEDRRVTPSVELRFRVHALEHEAFGLLDHVRLELVEMP